MATVLVSLFTKLIPRNWPDIGPADAGGTSMQMDMAAWSVVEVDKETENGYEKTGKMGDYKSFEKYDNTNKDGELAILVNKRFIVTG